jgi:predicted dehydrogenase
LASKVRVALAGLGSVSQRGILPHLAEEDAREHVELVACCDVVGERAQETARVFGWKEWYADYDEMLRRADAEAVLIATPIPAHYEQSIKALESGRHVYAQKTMTTTLKEATDVVALAGRKSLKLVASPGQMLNDRNRQMKTLIDDGALGKVYWAFSTNAGGGHENEGFRAGGDVLSNVDPTWYYKKGGGPVYDMTVYSLHTLTGILGSVQKVTAFSGIGLKERAWKDRRIEVEMDDNTLMLLDFGDSTFAVAGGQNARVSPSIGWGRLGFFGTKGTIDSGGSVGGMELSGEMLPQVLGFELPRVLVPSAPGQWGLEWVVGRHSQIQEAHVYNDIMHLVDCIANDKQPLATGEHARHVVEVIEKAYLSAQTGQAQTLETTMEG